MLEGELRVETAGETLVVHAGDTLTLPRDARRQISAPTDARAIVASPAGPMVTTKPGDRRPVPWST